MITEVEIGKLEALVKEFPAKLEDFVFDEELEKIKENPTRYQNLYTRLICPLHKRKVSPLIQFRINLLTYLSFFLFSVKPWSFNA